jgi:hypothetical protein
MNGRALWVGIAAVAALAAGSRAQPPVRETTLEERVLALERSVASLATRFDVRDAARLPGGDESLPARVAELERAIGRLGTDLQRVAISADNASREASQARRDAQDALREARDAAMRAR